MTLPGPWRLLAKRTLAVWPLVLASFGAVLLAATLLAAGPMYAGAAAQAGLERKLADAGAHQAGVDVTGRESAGGYEEASRRVEAELRRTLPGDAPVHRVVESDSVAAPDGRRWVLASVAALDAHATLAEGRWPAASGDALEAAISTAAAERTGIGVGDEVELVAERTVPDATVRVVGVYAVDDPEAAVWWNDELLLDGVRGRDTPTHGPLVLPERVLLDTVDRFRASWRIRPDAASFDVGELGSTARAVSGLEERLGEDVPRGEAPPVVSSGLPALLEESRLEVGVARSGVLVPLAQLALLAAYGLVFVAALIRRRRRREDELLLTRGAEPRTLALASALEAVLLAVLAALAAPWVAALAIELVSSAGPLASARLDLEPQVGLLPYALALAGAVACLAALVVPALRHERDADSHEARPGFFARTGLDLALLVAAAVALWQLRAEGAPVVAGGSELDLLLVAVPSLGILAGAVLAGRLLPPTLELLSRAAAARPGAIPALAARRLARTAVEHRPAAVLLVAALAIGTFAAAYARTWDATQSERATLQVGADVLVPDDRRSDAYPPLGRANAFAATEGVAVASPLAAEQLRIGGETVRLVAVDAARTPVAPVGATAARQDALLAELARRRPQGTRPRLSGATLRLTARTTIRPLPEGVEAQTIVRFGIPRLANVEPEPQLAVVVADADGLLYRLRAGALDEGETRLTVELGPDPRLPLELAGLELSYRVPGFVSRSLQVELDGPALAGVAWDVETSTFAEPIVPAAVSVTSGERLAVRLETGSSRIDVGSATVFLRPERRPDTPLPAIAGTGLLEALGARVGNVVELDASGGTREVELVGSLASFATVAEGDRFLVADLPTLFGGRYGETEEVRRPDAWALELETERAAPALAALVRPPLAVESAQARQRLESRLTNDPLAVATSGALWLGFFAAALFAVAAFAVAGAARSRKHLADASLLGALGLPRRGTRALLVLEDAVLALLAAAIGVGIGAALAALVLPAVAFTETGRASVPPPVVDVPWPTVLVLAAAVVGAIVLAALVRAWGASRASIAAELRAPAR